MASHISSKNTDLESIAYRSTPKFSSIKPQLIYASGTENK